ncbi:MAG: InlB B-repeat-containing protein [Candidatus Natronoplasma sp.]
MEKMTRILSLLIMLLLALSLFSAVNVDGYRRSDLTDSEIHQEEETDYILIEPEDDQEITAGENITYTATAYDDDDEEVRDVTEDTFWQIDEEAGGEWDQDKGTYTSEYAGDWTVTATYTYEDEEFEDDVDLIVEEGPINDIRIFPSNATVEAGDDIDYAAISYDEYGNKIENVTDDTEWDIDDEAGGEWDDYEYTSEYTGEWTVTGSYKHRGTSFVDEALLTVERTEVDYVTINPEEDQTVTVEEELEFTAYAYDEYDNLITEDVTEFEWENIEELDEEQNTALFYQEETGEYEVTATYEGEDSETTTVIVEPREIEEVIIEPSDDQTVTAGETIDFSAKALDDEGNVIEDDDEEFQWEGTSRTGLFQETETGEYTVTTSYEDVTSESVTVNVEPGEVAEVNIYPEDDQTLYVGEELEFTAEAYDEYDNLITDDVTEFEWENIYELDEDENVAVFYEEEEGSYEVIASYEDVTSESITVSVEMSEAKRVEIHILREQTIDAGEELELRASAYDEYGNLIAEDVEEFEWENIHELDEDENVAIFYQEETGEYEIRASYEGIEDSVTITVEASTPNNIEIEPDEMTTLAGDSLLYHASAYDEFGNYFGDVTAESYWSIDEEAGGEWDQDTGNYTTEHAGNWTVTATYTYEENELIDQAKLTVREADPVRIEIRPRNSTVRVGESQNYTTTAYDEKGNLYNITQYVEWSIDEEAGGSWSSNRYTSENPGTWEVYARYLRGGIELSDKATLTVEERTYALTISSIGGGFTEPTEGDHTYHYGEMVNITAISTTSWRFVEWSGDIKLASENATIVIESDMEIFAIFEERSYFEVEIVTPKEGEDIEGNSITVRFNVTNRGIIEGSTNVIIEIIGEDGSLLHTNEEKITLEPNQIYEGEFTWEAPAEGNFVLEIDSGDTISSFNMSVFESEKSEFKIPTIWLFFSFVPFVLIILIGWVHWKKS